MIELVEQPIDIRVLYERVRKDEHGAVVVFVGVVRRRSDDDRSVSGLSYEAYQELAVGEMKVIAQEVVSRFSPCEIAMQHRIGDLKVGEPSVAVAIATAHRAQAFDACRYAIDELKKRVPIWKKEHYVSGEAGWRENCSER
ncbi:MAG: molybdenum cofactor biosynthesis protein MoaE [Candidatus Eremiobacteraeota bacterium]|nr:molybdenum cofactor biosynthesis protein MoaE [Candidatus Eremiobacteraeota bacterium]